MIAVFGSARSAGSAFLLRLVYQHRYEAYDVFWTAGKAALFPHTNGGSDE